MITKNRVIYLSLIVSFAGYYFGKINNQQTNYIIKPVEKIVYTQSDTHNKPQTIIAKPVKPKIKNQVYQQLQQQNPYLLEYLPNQQTFNKIIDNLSYPELDDYFKKLVAKDDIDFNQIHDKHTFAKSLMREFLGESDNSHIDTYSTIDFSLSSKLNTDKITNFKISENRKTVYAHLQLDENTTMMDNTFIKWVNMDSSKILLFAKKNINSITRQNWVSFTPDKNWQTGNYQVTFYQFNSELKPIIQGNYYVE